MCSDSYLVIWNLVDGGIWIEFSFILGFRHRLGNLSNQIFNLEKINHCTTYCSGLSENVPPPLRLRYLNPWSLVDDAIWRSLVLLEEGYHWRVVFEI